MWQSRDLQPQEDVPPSMAAGGMGVAYQKREVGSGAVGKSCIHGGDALGRMNGKRVRDPGSFLVPVFPASAGASHRATRGGNRGSFGNVVSSDTLQKGQVCREWIGEQKGEWLAWGVSPLGEKEINRLRDCFRKKNIMSFDFFPPFHFPHFSPSSMGSLLPPVFFFHNSVVLFILYHVMFY